MPTVTVNEMGKIVIADEVIATATGIAALDCYGLADMAPRKVMRDSLSGFLGRDNPARGVDITSLPDRLEVELSIVVSYGTRIPEVAENLREKIRYTLQDTFGIQADKINIHVQGVKVPGER